MNFCSFLKACIGKVASNEEEIAELSVSRLLLWLPDIRFLKFKPRKCLKGPFYIVATCLCKVYEINPFQ